MHRYLVLYLDSLSFKCFSNFATLEEAREYLNKISPSYTTLGIVKVEEITD